MKTKTLFLTLNIFSATGGIEKMCRLAGKALYELEDELKFELKIFSVHDYSEVADNKYFPANLLRGFRSKKINFIRKSVSEGIKSKVVILSHINLLVIGYVIKLFSPKTTLILFAHGVEIWKPLSMYKTKMLKKCDRILAVSHFTKQKIINNHKVKSNRCEVLNNCLDPFLEHLPPSTKNISLLKRHQFNEQNIILMTLARLSSEERYKGYDRVIKVMHQLSNEYPALRYIIVGKYDQPEKKRIDQMIDDMDLKDKVVLSGFVSDVELAQYFNISDIYIMPSTGEGFGIVFIEAMFYNLPVIAGNVDGSVDALANGKLGLLVDPDNQQELIEAIKKMVDNKPAYIPDQKLLMEKFSYPVYKNNLKEILKDIIN